MTQPLRSALLGTLHDCQGACEMAAGGHGLGVMQARLAAATPSKWADAVVTSVSAAGWIEVALIADDSTALLWNHSDLSASIAVGDPVAVHAVYDVLAAGGAKHNVLRAAFAD